MAKRGKITTERADPIGALEVAGNELADLADEMRSWADSMASANMDHLEKYEQVESAADALENAELSTKVEALSQAIDTAIEGQEGHAECPTHQWGVQCQACGWSGNATSLVLVPPENYRVKTHPDPTVERPMRLVVGELYGYVPHTFGSSKRRLIIFNASWKSGEVPPPGVVEAKLAAMEARQAMEERRLRRHKPPEGRGFEPAIEPLPGFPELMNATVTWHEFHPYGKKATSRSDRFGNALEAARAGLGAVEHVLANIKIEAGDEETPELELLEAIREAYQECQEAVSELQDGVEFPGMY